jgi:hypothetical protein
MQIAEIIAKGNDFTPDEVELLKVEVKLFLNKIDASQADVLAERSNSVFSPAALETFFRKKERNENTVQILQYLLAFLDCLPGTAENENTPVNPIEQFLGFIRYQLDLLLKKDIKKAIFNEINQNGSRNGDNVWDYQGRIIEKNRELNELIVTGSGEVTSMFFTLCLVLEHLCLFWFDVKQGNMNRIRRSDIYIYKLVRILQGRSRPT